MQYRKLTSLCLSITTSVLAIGQALAKEIGTMAKKKVLIVVTSHGELGDSGKPTGYYLPEVTHPYSVLKSNGFEIDIASPNGGKAPMDPKSRDMSDSINKTFLEDKASAAKLENTLKLDDIKSGDYGTILFAGGHGTMWDFPDDKNVLRLGSEIYENGGIVAAVCHGPAALVNIKISGGKYLVDGRKVTAFTNEEEAAMQLEKVMPFLLESKLIERGASFEKAPNWQAKVITSERLITGQNPKSAEGVGEAIARAVLVREQTTK